MIKGLIKKYGNLVVGWLVLLCIIVLLKFGYLAIERIELFFKVLFVMWTYKIAIKVVNIEEWIKWYYGRDIVEEFEKLGEERKNNKEYKEFLERIVRIFKILLWVYKVKSPVYGLMLIEKKLFFFFGKVNLYYGKYMLLILFIVINCLVIMPINYILGTFYKMLDKIVGTEITDLFLKRIEGLIISLLILTRAYSYVLQEVFDNNLLYLMMFIYIILVIMSLIAGFLNFDYFGIRELKKKKKEGEIPESFPYPRSSQFMRAYSYENKYIPLLSITMLHIMYDRCSSTVIGVNLSVIVKIIVKRLKEDIIDKDDCFLVRNKTLYTELKVKRKYTAYLEGIVSQLVRYHELKMYMKDRPWMTIYSELSSFANQVYLGNILYGLEKYKDNEEVKKNLLGYLLMELESLREVLFRIWDIERYFGFKENGCYISDEYCHFENSNKNILFYGIDKDGYYYANYIEKSRAREEKFCDLEENLYSICEMIVRVAWIADHNEKSTRRKMANFFDKWDIHINDLGSYTFDFEKEVQTIDLRKVEPYAVSGSKIIDEMRGKWEKEWEEGRRNYKWEDLIKKVK